MAQQELFDSVPVSLGICQQDSEKRHGLLQVGHCVLSRYYYARLPASEEMQ
jgi:hypothetical protein